MPGAGHPLETWGSLSGGGLGWRVEEGILRLHFFWGGDFRNWFGYGLDGI